MRGNDTMEAGGFPGVNSGSALGALAWRVTRLRCMTPAETAHRCARAVQARVERFRLASLATVPRASLEELPAGWIECEPAVDAAPYRAAADRIVAGRFDIFALKDVQ